MTGEVLAAGLWLPHSPRRIGDRWWLCEAGSGTVGFVDDGRYVPVAALPGFARGLASIGDLVVAGHTVPRPSRASLGLPLHDRLRKERSPPVAGLTFLDPAAGAVRHRLRVDLTTGEVFAIVAIHG